MGIEEVRSFLLHLVVERKLGPANHKMHVAGLKFFYRHVVERPDVVVRIPWPTVPIRLPEIATGDEIERLLAAARCRRDAVLWMAAYGCGLRISEACALQVGDIDRARGVIHVRAGRGGRNA